MKALKKLTKARAYLVLNHPFWASLALQVPLVEDKNCRTGWTDGTKIAYNPGYIESLPEAAVVSFVAHEVGHPAFLHHLRVGDREHIRFNVAADYAINPILKEAGFVIPDGWLCDDKYKGMSAEAIYSRLPNGKSQTGKGGGSGGGGGQGSGAGCGPGEVRKYPGKDGKESSSSERRKEESDWKTKVSQAAQVAKSRGEMPGGLERYVREFLSPKIDWRAVLASYLSDTLESDYSWQQPNRRYLNSGIYLPSLAGEPSGNVLILIDTSGSISEKDMEMLAAEAQGIITSYEIELDVVYVDSRFQGHQHFTSSDVPLKLKPKSGGGTDYCPGFEWAKENGLFPSCAVYLTDGWCSSFPTETPAYSVLWVVTGDYPCKDFEAPFGEVIRMK